MKTPKSQFRFRAVSMEFVAHLNERYVEMLVMTSDGTTIAIECENDAIFAVQRNIEKIGLDCPEIMAWKSAGAKAALRKADAASYDAALSEGWHAVSLAA
jgi:hypothetical protein